MDLKMLYSRLRYISDMGFLYVLFRCWHEMQRRSGILRLRFPVNPSMRFFVSLQQWREQKTRFFFDKGTSHGPVDEQDLLALKTRVEGIRRNQFPFFGSVVFEMNDWHTNPENGYQYNPDQHWTDIPDFSKQAGDIKNVWEKSRFTFLYDLIRFEYHFKEDQSEAVLSCMLDWITQNPVNCGPNWKCGQEISLRVLNWTFALQYYKQAPALTEQRFQIIINSIYRQIEHVRENILFSRIAVRNNHALTETLTLYLVGLLFPFFPESGHWKGCGKKWFTEEIAFQIAEEGTFLQHSMNYHRVVMQLLTWGIRLAEANRERWPDVVYQRARRSFHFLKSCQDERTGWLPNYGHNDGALFFPLTTCHFRDFRPQLLALANVLDLETGYGVGKWSEESAWLGIGKAHDKIEHRKPASNVCAEFFANGGYAILRDDRTLTFLRCGHYNTRPSQADNLHLDIWVDGENILRDAGSYRYHTDDQWTKYFSGTASHNTLMLGDFDQMQKGPRFIWYDWIKESEIFCSADEEMAISGSFEGFRQVGKGIVHQRKVTKIRGELHWIVEDRMEKAPAHWPIHQIWHPSENFFDRFSITATGGDGKELEANYSCGWYAESYGRKSPARRVVYSTFDRTITTIIRAKKHGHTYANSTNSPVFFGR